MAGFNGGDYLEKARVNESQFVWDDALNLYFHSSSGFYHDPSAGWYYSSSDGLYYTFKNGTYVPLTSDKGESSEPQECANRISNPAVEDNQCNGKKFTSDGLENLCPPAEWLEETLINIYLSGDSKASGAESLPIMQKEEDEEEERSKISCDELADQVEQVEEEWMPEDMQNAEISADISTRNDFSLDEEKWQAQYGQVVQVTDACIPNISAIDLWDWKLVVETVKKKQLSRLSGRTIKRSCKLHPSVSAGGGILKTAAIRNVHLDLVHVASGKVYRLRTPNNKYLASLSTFDSSNPTKDWGFPDLFLNLQSVETTRSDETCGTNNTNTLTREKDVTPAFQEVHKIPYRDRAAERRSLHGQYSIGPGQKSYFGNNNLYDEESSFTSDPQEAAAEAMNMTFGKGSYARKILEKMGWSDGEALGSSNKGILKPLEAVANKGNAGLGWNNIC